MIEEMSDSTREAAGLADYLTDKRTVLPKPCSLEDAVEQSLSLFLESGGAGATFNLFFGNLSDQPFFAISPYPDLSEIVPGKTVDPRDLKAFIIKNQVLLNDPRNSIGLWYDEVREETWIDVSTV